MQPRTILVSASLALAVIWSGVTSAQQPAVASESDQPGVEQDADQDSGQDRDQELQIEAQQEQTQESGQVQEQQPGQQQEQEEQNPPSGTKKNGKKGSRTARQSRSPTLTQLDELVVEADRPLSAASSKVIRTRDYVLRPHSTTQEILNNVPGLVVVQH